MIRISQLFVALVIFLFWCIPATAIEKLPDEGSLLHGREIGHMVDLFDTEAVRAHSPFLVAHRGGVISAESPECSLAAIHLASAHGYRMVEIDAQETADGEAVVFHDRNLTRSCGIDKQIRELTSLEVSAIVYRSSDQHIATLDEALALARSLNLWVMLDIKTTREPPNTEGFFIRIGELLEKHGLSRSTVALQRSPKVLEHLAEKVVIRLSRETFGRIQDGESVSLKGKYWFSLPEHLPSEMVPKLQQNGALVIPAINTFRYPTHAHRELARVDVLRLIEAGVDGFQIDSAYEDLFEGKLGK